MPVADPTSGRLFIWLISALLFISIAAGGSFLILYVVLPQSQSRSWLPVAGLALICLPWLFWLLTCFYRFISRACGFRVAIGGGNAGGGCAHARSNVFNASSNEHPNPESPPLGSPEGEGRRVQFGGAVVIGERDENGVHDKKNATKRSLSASNSSNDMSIASHESELPLTSSMAC